MATGTHETLVARLHQRMAEMDVKARHVSMAATGKPDTVRNILRGRAPSIERLLAVADYLGVTVAWLTGADDTPPPGKRPIPDNARPALDVTLPNRHDMPRDVPVLGTAAGAVTGAMQLEPDNVVDYVRRPPGIADAKNVYAIYVVGESMEPRYFAGDLVYVHPDRAPRVGDFVIVQTRDHEHDTTKTYIKRLVRRTAKWVIVEQSNPPRHQQFKWAHIVALHRVLTMNDLMGV